MSTLSGHLEMEAQFKQPAIVIVPGTWQVLEHYAEMSLQLQTVGYEVRTVDLPSNGALEDTGDFLAQDTAVVIRAIRSFTDHGKDVLMFFHSCGAISGCDAVWVVSAESRRNPYYGKIIRMIFLNARLLEKGSTFIEKWGDRTRGEVVRTDVSFRPLFF